MEQIVMEKEAPHLPQEIITNILVRLSVKSLIRFQCVCKDWKNLFKTPSFISEHLHHSTRENPLLAVDWTISEGNPLHLCLLNREMQFLEFLQNPHITDSLLFGKFRLVPEPLISLAWNYSIVGFGFSPIINDYKIVRLFCVIRPGIEGDVYALSTGLWRKIELRNFEGSFFLSWKHFTVNGAIFWFGCKVERDYTICLELIVSFDIASEVITLIPFPTVTPAHRSCYEAFTSYENKLAIFFPLRVGNSESYMIDVWVLEECADPSRERWSWANVYTSRPIPYNYIIRPQTIWRNDIVCTVEEKSKYLDEGNEENFKAKVFLCNPKYLEEGEEENFKAKVVLCNLNTGEFNLFDIPRPSVEIFDYVESLVLLDDIHG